VGIFPSKEYGLATSEKTMKMGLGAAIRRLMDVEKKYQAGMRNAEITTERNLLLEALDRLELDIGWDCDDDGVPDTVEIFKQSAATSCCRILPGAGSRKKAPGGDKAKPSRVRRSRK